MNLFIKKYGCVSSTIVALSLTWACGLPNPSVQEQSSSSVKEPEAQGSDVISFTHNGTQLTAVNKEHNYRGSMVFWNEDADPEKVSEVATLSIKSKDAKNLYRKESLPIPQYEQDIASKEKRLQDLRIEEQAQKANYYQNQSSKLAIDSETWIRSQLVPGKETEFEMYCDAALLKFGVSEFLRQNNFSSRPAPLAICEGYYQKKGLFHTPTCNSIKDEEGNYFKCIWEGGILETFTLFLKNGKTKASAQDRLDFINELDQLPTWLKDQTDLDTSVFRFSKAGDKLKLVLEKYNPTAKKLEPLLSGVADLFVDPSKAALFMEPLTIERATGGQGADRKVYTFNDRLFNFHHIKGMAPLLGSEQNQLAQLQLDFPQVFGDQPHAAGVEEERAAINKDLAKLKVALVEAKAKANPHQDTYNNKCDLPASDIIKKYKLAPLLLSLLDISLTPKGNLVSLQLNINSGDAMVGCFDWATGSSRKCEGTQTKDDLIVSYDKSTLLLSISTVMEDPIRTGLTETKQTDGSTNFQLVPVDTFKGKTLLFELYPRKHGEYLDALTGMVFVKDANSTVFQGSLNFNTKLY